MSIDYDAPRPATEDDVARWEAAFVRSDGMEERPTVFLPIFCAVGRRP